MKKNLPALFFGLFCLSASAQMPYIATPTIIPQNPNFLSVIKVAVNVTTPNQGIVVDANTFTVTGQQIFIKGCYWQGMATATQSYVDTLTIGQLPVGNYQVIQKAYLSTTQQHCTKVDSNMTAPVQVVVSPVTGIVKNGSDAEFNVYPNPSSGTLFINGFSTEAEVSVFSTSGTLIRKEWLSNKPLDIRDLEDGLYFIRINSHDKITTTRFVKLGQQ